MAEQYKRGYSGISHSAHGYSLASCARSRSLPGGNDCVVHVWLVSGPPFYEGRCCYLCVRSDRDANCWTTDGLDLAEMRELRLELDTSRKVGVDTRVGERERCSSDALDASI